MKRSYAHLLPLLLGILIILPALAAVSPAKAYSEVLDQSNDPLPVTVTAIPAVVPNSLFQSFKPVLPRLTSVDLRVANYNKTVYATMEVRIREGSFSGPILGASPFTVPPDHNKTNTILIHVTFPSPIDVTPGSTYLIELFWSSNKDQDVWWAEKYLNPYADGQALGPDGAPTDDSDFHFQTWGTIAVGGEVISTPAGSYASLLVAATAASALVLGYRLAKRRPSTSPFSAKY